MLYSESVVGLCEAYVLVHVYSFAAVVCDRRGGWKFGRLDSIEQWSPTLHLEMLPPHYLTLMHLMQPIIDF